MLTHQELPGQERATSDVPHAPVSWRSLPCQSEDEDLWFSVHPAELGRAQQLCQQCPIRAQCLEEALLRGEPWGVWGGEIFDRGQVILFKRGRGRPAKPKPSFWWLG